MNKIITIGVFAAFAFASPAFAGDANSYGNMAGTAVFAGFGSASSSGSFDLSAGSHMAQTWNGGTLNVSTSNVGNPGNFGFGFVSGNVASGGFSSHTPTGAFASSGTSVQTTSFSIGPVMSNTNAGGYAGACAGRGC